MVKFLQNDEEIGLLQFPITETGTTTTASFMIENNSEDNVELIFYSEDGDVKAESYPKKLLPRESQLAKLTFSPSKERNDPLNTRWGFREIIG